MGTILTTDWILHSTVMHNGLICSLGWPLSGRSIDTQQHKEDHTAIYASHRLKLLHGPTPAHVRKPPNTQNVVLTTKSHARHQLCMASVKHADKLSLNCSAYDSCISHIPSRQMPPYVTACQACTTLMAFRLHVKLSRIPWLYVYATAAFRWQA